MTDMELAPCIAVIGPANAGKTTLLHLLDERLQQQLTAAYVIKGNPDHTGRYLFRAPNLREDLKPHVKGSWGSLTIDHISESIECARRNLEIALVDFGGKHNPENKRMLKLCSHYIVVSRLGDADGQASWEKVAAQNDLKCIARMRSIGPDHRDAPVIGTFDKGMEGTFRYDVGPAESTNDAVISCLTDSIVMLRRRLNETPYIHLHSSDRWTEADIPEVKGRAAKIREIVAATGEAVLGGVAPIWAYLAALRCGLLVNRSARILYVDPKLAPPLVEIPQNRQDGEFPEGVLSLGWTKQSNRWRLEIQMLRDDKFLPPQAAEQLACAPSFGELPGQDICLWGARPNWLAGAYARWLIDAGVNHLDVFDASTQKDIRVWW